VFTDSRPLTLNTCTSTATGILIIYQCDLEALHFTSTTRRNLTLYIFFMASGSDPSGLPEADDTSWLHSGENTLRHPFGSELFKLSRSRVPTKVRLILGLLARCGDLLPPTVLSSKTSAYRKPLRATGQYCTFHDTASSNYIYVS
jgi:hypothetical protein